MNKKYEFYALISLFILVNGISFSVINYGSDSDIYYVFIFLAFALALPKYIESYYFNKIVFYKITAFIFLFPVYYLFHLLFSIKYISNPSSVLQYYIAMSLIVYFAGICSLISNQNYEKLMIFIVYSHLILIIFGLYTGGFSSDLKENERFSSENVREIVWAEFSLGMFAASVLSKKIRLIIISFICIIFIYSITLVRATLLSGAVGFIVYIFLQYRQYRSYLIILTSISFFYAYYTEYVSAIFLLDDPYRGTESGFAGRFENWSDGFNLFIDNIFFGVGLEDPVAAFTHNAFLKVLCQFGVIFFLIYIYIISKSLFKSFFDKKYNYFVAILVYLIFVGTSPRTINFQVMPFISLTAIAIMILNNKKYLPSNK